MKRTTTLVGKTYTAVYELQDEHLEMIERMKNSEYNMIELRGKYNRYDLDICYDLVECGMFEELMDSWHYTFVMKG